MKFSSSLKFNAVSEWWDEYIAYDSLKKCIYQLEKQQQHGHEHSLIYDPESNEQTTLLPDHQHQQNGTISTDAMFTPLLDRELRKIVSFYEHQEKELINELKDLEKSLLEQEEAGMGLRYYDDVTDEDEDDEDSLVEEYHDRRRSSYRRRSTNTRSGGAMSESPIRRRTSISSMDEIHPEHHDDNTKPLKGSTLNKLSHTFNSIRGSFSSSHDLPPDNTVWMARSDYAYDVRLLFKRRIRNLYIAFTNLRSFVEINYSGFRKIIKKYDKVTYSELKDRYLHNVVELSPPFTQGAKDRLNDTISRLLDIYTKCVTRGNENAARQQLRLHQRENIAWERDTVWRQMIGQQRRGEGDDVHDALGASLVKGPEPAIINIPTPVGRFRITKRKIFKVVAVAVFILLLNMPVVKGKKEANRCFAILSLCTILWASEAIPLFVTSMLVPLLLVLFQVILDKEGVKMDPPAAAKFVFSAMFSPTIMLLIGGFTISSALSKTNIDRILITRVLSLAGTQPSRVLLAFMGVSCFASMWISNVAAPTLCFTLIRPILRTLPPKSAFGPCLILAIALAANIGGQSSPISSPQNLIALAAMDPQVSWLQWFVVALPVSGISIVLIWLLLLVSYRPARSPDGEGNIEIRAIRATRDSFSVKQAWVTFVCVVTICLWCLEHWIHEIVGDMGVIALFPLVAFFSTGVLKKDDFEQFAWTIVFLAMGGIALGNGVMSSGLLTVLDGIIRNLIHGLSLYTVVVILSLIVLVVSTFISHTIASVLLVPIAKEVGSSLPGHHKNLLIFITGLVCSAGMGMPVSGFPNQTAATQEDELGELYLTNVDFLKNGVPASMISTLVVATVGYVLMRVIGVD